MITPPRPAPPHPNPLPSLRFASLRSRPQVSSLVFFSTSSLLQILTSLAGAWLSFWMFKVNSWKFNAATVTALLCTISSLSESYRNPSYIFRSLPPSSPTSLDGPHFDMSVGLNLPISIVSLVQCLLGLGLSWIDIAESSSTLTSPSGSRRLTWSKAFLRAVMLLVTVAVVFLAARNRTVEMAYLGIALTVIILPVLVVGGNRLRALLLRSGGSKGTAAVQRAGAHAKPMGRADLGGGIRRLVLQLVFVLLCFVGGCITMTTDMANTYNTGKVLWKGGKGVFSMFIISMSMWGSSFCMLSFFFVTNKHKIDKARGAVDSTVFLKRQNSAFEAENPLAKSTRREKTTQSESAL